MKIAVIATGKIGLPLATQFASMGHEVVGIDVNEALVDCINRGVLVLKRTPEGNYHEILHDEVFRLSELAGEASKRLEHNGRGPSVIVEEAITSAGKKGDDWKVFAFNGEIGLIQQRVPLTNTLKFYTLEGVDAGKIRTDSDFDFTLSPPKNFSGLLDAAARVSLQVPTGFIRVDLYERQNGGIVLGELCLVPGLDLYFLNGWDLKLGQMWHEANVRLLQQRLPLIP